ncbi:unnamed protein product [Cyprideis torosa]|uniref:Uncharacterized protein n=1 Tax=Cyprideis torosa TaxID=163714 RepID=A0A7R8ZVG3_9CRUS|nr:unnamed protein product [Cyprideis torosa]CAG0902669.1 unnamed protein product [Cyprideis torosa]
MLKHAVVFDLSSHIWLFIIPRDDLLFRKYDKIPGLWISFQRINRQKIDHRAPEDYSRSYTSLGSAIFLRSELPYTLIRHTTSDKFFFSSLSFVVVVGETHKSSIDEIHMWVFK